jgi:hypothetical protein
MRGRLVSSSPDEALARRSLRMVKEGLQKDAASGVQSPLPQAGVEPVPPSGLRSTNIAPFPSPSL